MITITPEILAELKRLEAAATPGPWKLHEVDDTSIVEGDRTPIAETCPHGGEDADRDYDENWERHEANAALIAAARNHLRALIDDIEISNEMIATNAHEIADLRRQLAEAGAEIERERGVRKRAEQKVKDMLEARSIF